MRIKVSNELPNNGKGPVILMAQTSKKKFFEKVMPGSEFEIEDALGNKLLGEYSDILQVISYGEPKVKMINKADAVR